MPTIDNDAPASLHREDLKCCFRLKWTEVNVQISNILSLACSLFVWGKQVGSCGLLWDTKTIELHCMTKIETIFFRCKRWLLYGSNNSRFKNFLCFISSSIKTPTSKPSSGNISIRNHSVESVRIMPYFIDNHFSNKNDFYLNDVFPHTSLRCM